MHRLPIITSKEQLKQVIEQSHHKPLWLYKHSSHCGSSKVAHVALNKFLTYLPQLSSRFSFAIIRVVEEKGLSDEAAQLLNTPHMSPQILLVSKRKVVWNSSHQQINSRQLSRLAHQFLQSLAE